MDDTGLIDEIHDDNGNAVGVRINGYIMATQGLILKTPGGLYFAIRTIDEIGTVQTEQVTGING